MHYSKKIHLILFFFLSILSGRLNAQIISQDSRGKDILENYKGNELQASLTPGQFSLQAGYSKILGNPYYYYINGDTAQKTVSKSRAISFTGKVTGAGTPTGKPFSITNQLVRPAFKLEIGHQWIIEKFDSILLVTQPSTFTAGISAYIEFQNVNFYDTLTKVASKKRPVVFGLHGHLTLFETYTGRFALSLSGDISRSYRQNTLKLYQTRSEELYIDQNITAVNDVIGNIGSFDEVATYRFRTSIPVFLTKHVNIIPYISVFGNAGGQASQLTGFNINFGNGIPRQGKTTLANGFGLGMDWLQSMGKWTSPNYFVYGTLDIKFFKGIFKPRLSGTQRIL